jgi:hypothetical protein
MPPRVSVTVRTSGEQKLARVGNAIKASGDKGLDRALRRAGQRCGKPMKTAAREGALKRLPKRGGLAERVATSKFSVRMTSSGKRVGVRIIGRSGYDLQGMDDGKIRKPVYGNRKNWVSQEIASGWFSESEEAAAPKFRAEFDRALDELGRELEARG